MMDNNAMASRHPVGKVRALSRLWFLVSVGILFASQSATAQLPPNFTQETVLSGLTAPVYLETLPDGRMLVLRKTGQILIFDPAQQPAQTSAYLTITDINSANERGLTSLVLDPNFATNGYFYVYYTHGTSNRNRISRFTHLGNNSALNTEVLIWQDNTNWSNCCHYGGGLDFGPDGKLYLTTGEEFDGNQSQDMTQAGGKILRINKDGTIPSDNPFVDGPGGNLDEIWAVGLRNPYRAHWDLVNQRFFVGDVGGNTQSTAREEINIGVAGGNYAWPSCEGVCNNPAWVDPIYDYGHTVATPNGGAVTAGFVYRGSLYPVEYVGAFFFSDYVLSQIKYLTLNPDGSVANVTDFASDVGAPVALEQGPDGALYVVDYYFGRVLRFAYDSANQVPQIDSVDVTPTLGAPPLDVTFSATATDPESQPLTYRWFFGDGTDALGENVLHTYSNAGTYNVLLQVSDGVRSAFSDPVLVEVGTPPVVTITAPADGATFRAGDVINYAGTAVDPDETIPASNYRWDVVFFHNAHLHPVVSQQPGTSGQLVIEPSGHDWHDDTGYELTLTVTDSQGLSRSDSIRLYPDKVDVTLATVPAGIPVYVDGIPRDAPYVYDTLIGFEHVVAVPGSYCLNNTQQIFTGWSDGGAATHQITVPAANQTLTATFMAGGACDALPASGLVAHFEADTGVTTVGGAVTAWLDQSGNGNNLVGAGDPELVTSAGVPVIDFDGTGDKLERVGNLVGLPIADASRTVYLVANYRGVGYGGFAWGNAAINETFGLIVAPNGRLMVQGWGAANDFDSGDAGTGQGWLVQSVVLAGGQLSHYRNGQLIDSRTHTYATGAARLVLGAEIDSNPFINMQVGAVLVYDRALTAQEQQQVQTYLQTKYFNNVPVANDDAYVTAEDSTLTVPAVDGVLIDDTDADNDPLTAVLESDVANGTLTLNTDGSFTYVPDANFSGVDAFQYRADDGRAPSAPATVNITVSAQNDPPVAVADAYAVAEDSSLITTSATGVLANDVELDGGVLSAVLVTNVSNGVLALNGNGSFTYTPSENYSGPDSFSYHANDGLADSNVVTVSITVNAGNDLPAAAGDAYSVDEDSVLTVGAPGVLANDTDVDGNPLTAVLGANVAHGSLALSANGSFVYTPNANYHGPDSFTYRANDGTANSGQATVTITVNPVNDAPAASNDAYSVDEDFVLTVPAPGVLGNDTDVDNDALTAAIVSDVTNGTLVLNANGSFAYTPDAGFGGTDSFTYRAADGTTNSNVATVTIVVNAIDDPPRLTGAIVAPAATESAPYSFDLGAFFVDDEGSPLFYEADVGPHPVGLPLSGRLLVDPDGSLSGVRGRLFGTPEHEDTSDNGPRTVTLTVADRPFSDPNRQELTTTFELTISALDRIDLSVTATAAPSPAAVDETVDFEFTVSNGNALLPADQVELELTFGGSAPFAFTATSDCTVAAQVVSCVFGPVAAAGSVTRTVSLKASAPGDLHVAASVAMPAGGPIDPNPANNTAVAAVGVGGSMSSGPAQTLTALPSVAVATGDLDADGYDDLVVAGGVSQALGVYYSESKDPADPDAEFRKLATTPVVLAQLATHVQDLRLVDVDNDNDLDVVLANGATGAPEANSVYLNAQTNGQTTLTLLASLGSRSSRSVAAADLDGNGFVDLVFANSGPNEVFLNQGSGVFAAPALLGSGDSRAVAIADFDGDLLPDLAFAKGDGASEVYRNLGAGAFGAPLAVEPAAAAHVAAADLDGDGAPDLVFARSTAAPPDVPSNTVHRNTSTAGAIGFTKREALGATPTAQVHVADFNEDGFADVLSVNATGTHQLFVGGALAFTLHGQIFATGVPQDAEVGDFNNDGRPDVAIATSAGVEVFLSDGLGHFGTGDTEPPTIQLAGQPTMTLTAGSAFTDPGATATDAIDGSLTSAIAVTNPVNSNVPGTYKVAYDVADRSGNKTRATRTVTVEPAPWHGNSGGGGGSTDLLVLLLLLASLGYRATVKARARRAPSQPYTAAHAGL